MQTTRLDQNPGNGLNIRQLAITFWSDKWWIIATTLLSGAIAVVYAFSATPVYRAEAIVQIRQDSGIGTGLKVLTAQFGGLVDLAGLGSGNNSDRAFTLATLKSRLVIQAFIQENDLLPVLFEENWDPESRSWKVADPKKHPTLWHGYKFFSENLLKISEDKKTGLVVVAIEWRDPEMAAAWVAELIARTNTYLRQKTIADSENNLSYLQQQLRQTGLVELRQAVFTLTETELKKLMLAKGGSEYAITTVDPAQAPRIHSRPKRKQIVLLGLVFGMGVGLFSVLAKGAISRMAGPEEPSHTL